MTFPNEWMDGWMDLLVGTGVKHRSRDNNNNNNNNSVLLKCSTHVGPHILRIPGVQLLALPSVSPPSPLGAIHRVDWHICRFETARNWQFHIQLCSPPTDTFEGGTRHPDTSPMLALGRLSAGPRDLQCQFALRPANKLEFVF